MPTDQNVSIYQKVTQRIIEALERGVLPWTKPWVSGPHVNAVSRRAYRGINVLQLELTAQERGFRCRGWLTFRQARQLGGHVRPGEKATMIVWYERRPKRKLIEPSADLEVDNDWIWLARCFWVFNVEQCAGLDALRESLGGRFEFQPLEECERVVRATGAVIRYNGSSAFYDPATDQISLPPRASFVRPEFFYGVAFHELTHWTGAPHRLGRDQAGRFGDASYAFEELVAELGAAFLCARSAIEHTSQAAAYLNTWLRALRRDCRILFTVARLAADAADYIAPIGLSVPEAEADAQLAS